MTATLITEDQLWELVESIWSTMLGPVARHDGIDDIVRDSVELTASVHISGAFHGAVLFSTTDQFARWATAALLGVPESSLAAPDVNDAVGELCNILGGGVKSLLPGPSSLSLPCVMRGSHFEVRDPPANVAAELRFTCEGQPLVVSVLEEVRYALHGASQH